MKALEKDRNRRYETASGFALDLQHHLNDEPVVACRRAELPVPQIGARNKGLFAAAAPWWPEADRPFGREQRAGRGSHSGGVVHRVGHRHLALC